MEGNEKLEQQVGDLLATERDPRTSWAHWMGTEMASFHPSVWEDFLNESFSMLMRYRKESQRLRDQQQQPQPRPGPSQAQDAQAPTPMSAPIGQQWQAPGFNRSGFSFDTSAFNLSQYLPPQQQQARTCTELLTEAHGTTASASTPQTQSPSLTPHSIQDPGDGQADA